MNKMTFIKKFEDIEAWQKARKLTNKIYEISSKDDFAADFILKGQTRKASISIMLNIAEGYARRSNREFRKFLDYAHGSCAEVQSALYVALDQKYLSEKTFKKLYSLTEEISRMITNFSIYLYNNIKKNKNPSES